MAELDKEKLINYIKESFGKHPDADCALEWLLYMIKSGEFDIKPKSTMQVQHENPF